MAYDSKTYGQSPFGNPTKPDTTDPPKTSTEDGLDQGPVKSVGQSGLANKFPSISTSPATTPKTTTTTATSSKSTSKRKSAGGTKTTRKSKKAKAAEAAKAELEAAEAAVARRFLEEDQRAYLSLLQKTGISGLVWAVLRLSPYELPDDATAIVNIIINPLLIATLAFAAMVGLTFWLRTLLNDLARHTQQLQIDAEDEKNNRPTLEILGDSLEYNPKLRKSLVRFFNVSSILICSLVSYLLVIGLTLPWQVK